MCVDHQEIVRKWRFNDLCCRGPKNLHWKAPLSGAVTTMSIGSSTVPLSTTCIPMRLNRSSAAAVESPPVLPRFPKQHTNLSVSHTSLQSSSTCNYYLFAQTANVGVN